MSITGLIFRVVCAKGDWAKTHISPSASEDIVCIENIPYGSDPKWNLMNVYYPRRSSGLLPTIINIHGGGYVYGDVRSAHPYCLTLARHGFAVVSFNYRLAPQWHFPAPLEDTNAVIKWVYVNAEEYHIDRTKLLLVGDSAGAQISSQYAAILTNRKYASLFAFEPPNVEFKALGVNCGVFDLMDMKRSNLGPLVHDYLGGGIKLKDPRLQVIDNITPQYPPVQITTAYYDFFKESAHSFQLHLQEKDIKVELKEYGSKERKDVGHIFHLNTYSPDAALCNDNQCAFFRRFI